MRARSLLLGALAVLLALAGPRAAAELEPYLPEHPPFFVPRARSRVRRLEPRPEPRQGRLGDPLAAVDLRRQLDALREAGSLRLGGISWRIGLAADPDFKYFFAAFTRDGGATALCPLSLPRDALHEGVVVRPDAAHAYRIRCKVKLTDPVRGSDVAVWPVEGDRKNAASWSSGELLDLLERRASYFRLDGDDYYVAYLSDVDPRTGRATGTRSFLFFHERRFSAHAWVLAEKDVPTDRPLAVKLGDVGVAVLRRRGLLIVYPGS